MKFKQVVHKKFLFMSNTIYYLKLVWEASPKRILISGGSTLFQRSLEIFYNLLFIRYIIEAMEKGVDYKIVALFCVGLFALFFIRDLISNYSQIYLNNRSEVDIVEYLMDKVYQKAIYMDLACYENPKFYDAYTRANEEVLNDIDGMIATFFHLIFYQLYGLIAYAIAVILYEPVIFPIVLLFFILSQKVQMKFVEARFERRQKTTSERRRMDYLKRVVYQTEYVKDLRLTNIFEPLVENFKIAAEEMRATAGYYGKKAGWLRFISSLVASLSTYLLVQGIIIYRFMYYDAYTFAVLITVISAANGLSMAISGFTHTLGWAQEKGLSIDNYRQFLSYESKVVNSDQAQSVDTTIQCDLRMNNVSFIYEGADKPVLNNVNIQMNKGEKIALVGHNGAGKSTLVKLMMRLYDPTSGSVELNGKDIREYDLKGYRDNFGTVFQDYKLFAASINENVVMNEVSGVDEEKQIIEALKETGIHERIERLPNKTSSILTKEFDDDGVLLSGGEGQKIAVARSFVHKGDIVILDEPSSALDPLSEHQIFESMLKACADKSVIFVSHRLSSATLADRIYLMEQGEIIEEGTHKSLMAMNRKYAHMYKLQSKNYQGMGATSHESK